MHVKTSFKKIFRVSVEYEYFIELDLLTFKLK